MNIKELKPKKNSRFKQGYVDPNSCKKLFENLRNQPIIYRSSWELKFIKWCESSKKVKNWGSECISIEYYNPIDHKNHHYYPDFVVVLENDEKMVIEIKPKNQTEPPLQKNSWAYKTFVTNSLKWGSVQKAYEERGYKFCILTEKTIQKL